MLEIRPATLVVKKVKDRLVLDCPELGFKLSFPISKIENGLPLMANLPALVKRNGNKKMVVPPNVLDVLRKMQEDPKLVDKLVAVTEAYAALED